MDDATARAFREELNRHLGLIDQERTDRRLGFDEIRREMTGQHRDVMNRVEMAYSTLMEETVEYVKASVETLRTPEPVSIMDFRSWATESEDPRVLTLICPVDDCGHRIEWRDETRPEMQAEVEGHATDHAEQRRWRTRLVFYDNVHQMLGTQVIGPTSRTVVTIPDGATRVMIEQMPMRRTQAAWSVETPRPGPLPR